jgi:hypothetical protein
MAQRTAESGKVRRERRTIRAMVGIYCRDHHGGRKALCAECQALVDYALGRLERCPFGDQKTVCAQCPVHCYKPAMRTAVKSVMRYAGPRMLFRHPLLALQHRFDAVRNRRTAGKSNVQRGGAAPVSTDQKTAQ